jgi:hypothetical protein
VLQISLVHSLDVRPRRGYVVIRRRHCGRKKGASPLTPGRCGWAEGLELELLSDEIQYRCSGQGQEMRTGIASASGGEERVMNRARGHEILATESE